VQKTAKVAEAEATKAASKAEAEARIVAAEAQRDSELKIAEFRKETEKATAEANAVGPRTLAEQNVLIVKAEQSAAAERAVLRQKELAAEVNAVADADLYRAQKAADAALYAAQKNAEAEAARVKKAAEANKDRLEAEGLGEANATRAKGLAEGEAIRAKGEAEAQVKELLAAAYEKYGQQAVIDRVLAALPEIFAAAAKPLGEIDNITVVGSADGASGVQQLVTDLTTSVPATVKATTGLDITALITEYLTNNNGKLKSSAKATPTTTSTDIAKS
jgi:flotillin